MSNKYMRCIFSMEGCGLSPSQPLNEYVLIVLCELQKVNKKKQIKTAKGDQAIRGQQQALY